MGNTSRPEHDGSCSAAGGTAALSQHIHNNKKTNKTRRISVKYQKKPNLYFPPNHNNI